MGPVAQCSLTAFLKAKRQLPRVKIPEHRTRRKEGRSKETGALIKFFHGNKLSCLSPPHFDIDIFKHFLKDFISNM